MVMDADTLGVLYEKNADKRSLIASTTKIMTALVVLEHLPTDRAFAIPPEATGIEGSSMYLRAGESLTVEALLYGLMLHSGNDAAVALALLCAGSMQEFVNLMNLKAQKLGLKDTHFENPNGLDAQEHYSTARDLAKLTAYALQNDEFCRIVGTKTKTIGDRCLKNHNRLLWMCDGCIGVKTGYTKAAGRVLVSAARRNGRTLIVVTIRDGNDWQDHMRLYDEAFQRFENRVVICKGQSVSAINLNGQRMELCATQSVQYPLLPSENVRVTVEHLDVLTRSATAEIWLGEKRIALVALQWGSCHGTDTENHSFSGDRLPSGS